MLLVLTSCQTTDNSRSADARMYDGNHISELTLESRVKVGAALNGAQAIAVSEFCENSDIATILELCSCRVGVRRRMFEYNLVIGTHWSPLD